MCTKTIFDREMIVDSSCVKPFFKYFIFKQNQNVTLLVIVIGHCDYPKFDYFCKPHFLTFLQAVRYNFSIASFHTEIQSIYREKSLQNFKIPLTQIQAVY